MHPMARTEATARRGLPPTRSEQAAGARTARLIPVTRHGRLLLLVIQGMLPSLSLATAGPKRVALYSIRPRLTILGRTFSKDHQRQPRMETARAPNALCLK